MKNPKVSSALSEMSHQNDVQISKALSAVLRHNKMGFKVDSRGFLNIEEILNHSHFKYKLNATKDKIYKVVNNNDKKRFETVNENGIEKIRAVQGHSVQVY